MKKRIVLIALLAALLLLSACGEHQHQWRDATCTEPETCTECGETRGKALDHRWIAATCTEPEFCARCGETRGEPLGHDWKEATCTEPEICSRCGETRGEPLGHDWKEATCTEPEICSRCGETRGEPLGHDAAPADYWTPSVCTRCGEELEPALIPDFEFYGLNRNIIGLNETVDYKTICYDDPSYRTVGKLTFLSYETTPGNDELEALDGYEWRILTFEVKFDDENANEYGMSIGFSIEDYYDIRYHDDMADYSDETWDVYKVVYKGETYACRTRREGSFAGWKDKQNVYTGTFYVQVPVGYDGVVFGLRDRGVEWPDDAYVFDIDFSSSIYFRLK